MLAFRNATATGPLDAPVVEWLLAARSGLESAEWLHAILQNTTVPAFRCGGRSPTSLATAALSSSSADSITPLSCAAEAKAGVKPPVVGKATPAAPLFSPLPAAGTPVESLQLRAATPASFSPEEVL